MTALPPRPQATRLLLATRRRGRAARLPTGLRELLVFALAYLTYFGVRAVTEGRPHVALDNADGLVRAEQAAGIAWEHTVQAAFLPRDTLLSAANALYIWGHWPVLIVGGILLFHLSRPHYVLLRNVCLVSGGIGLLIFVLFPLAPPRLAGFGIDTVTLHAETYRRVLPPSLVNEYAAMPSFHAGWNLLLGITLFRASHHLLVRLFAVVMPAGMALAVVATANHYILDVVAGAAIVVAALLLVDWTERRTGTPPSESQWKPSSPRNGRRSSSPIGRAMT